VHDRSSFYPIGWWETDRLGESTSGAYAKHWWNGKTSPEGWTRKPVFSAPSPRKAIRYDLGGSYPRDGYVSVPLARGRAKECNIVELDDIHAADGEVDEFLLNHTLEHVPVTRYVPFLRDLYRKLRAGGCVVVVQTDADAVITAICGGRPLVSIDARHALHAGGPHPRQSAQPAPEHVERRGARARLPGRGLRRPDVRRGRLVI
jgi:hypothetical protein